MEEVARGGAVDNNPIAVIQLIDVEIGFFKVWQDVWVIVAHLQEPLWAGGGMFWTHALHAMGQQQHDAILPHPLGLSRADELVDDALGRVVEVTKLGFQRTRALGLAMAKPSSKPSTPYSDSELLHTV